MKLAIYTSDGRDYQVDTSGYPAQLLADVDTWMKSVVPNGIVPTRDGCFVNAQYIVSAREVKA